MNLHVGLSAADDVGEAAAEAVGTALRAAQAPVFALLFCTDRYDLDALAAVVTRELGATPWAGCLTAGVFAGAEMHDQGIVCGVFSTHGGSFGVGVGGPLSVDARAAGAEAAAQAIAGLGAPHSPSARTFIVLTDALTGNGPDVVRGAARVAGAGAVWAGGGAGNATFDKSAQFALGRCWSDRVVVIAIEAPRPVAVGIKHGWHPYGPAVTVTRSSGVTANELEYERAFDVYRRTAASRGDRIDEPDFARFAMSHPLGIPQANGEFVIRDPLSIDSDGSLRCVAEVPDGAIVRVMQGDRADLLGAANAAAIEALGNLESSAGGAIVFDCVSRSLVLGPDVRDELEVLQRGVGRDVALMGCLTLGEVGALGGAAPQFHNKTAVVMALPCLETARPTGVVARTPPASDVHVDPLSLASGLQELAAAGLELFDPKRSPDPFLDRVAERIGCYAALLLEVDERGALSLLGASGIATTSRELPFVRAAAGTRCSELALPYPELATSTLVCWRFPIDTLQPGAELVLYFRAAPILSHQLHGMVGRLTRILSTVLIHRRLFARTVESERRLAEERVALAAAREAAERANAAKDEFLAVVSHEIRNRLNPVLQWTRLLRTGEVHADRVPHALEVIERNAALQSRLIEDLLDLDRADRTDTGTFRIRLRQLDLGSLVAEEAEIVGLAATKKGISLHVATQGDPPMISGDADRIRQVIANLLENAVKFTPPGGRVDALTTRDGGVVRLQVTDTGRGIAPELLAGIFELFKRGAPIAADPAEGSRGSGLGIGLALVKRIVLSHGGKVRAESAGQDRGATFTVELPASR